MLTKDQKKKIVEELTKMLEKAKSTVFFDFSGLSMPKLLMLRKNLKKEGIKLRITKKNLFKLAAAKLGIKEYFDLYKGSIALIADEKGQTQGAKILKQFKDKEVENLVVLGGILEARFISASEVLQIADLPSQKELLAQLLSILQAPTRNFVSVISTPMRDFLQLLKNKK